MFKKVPLALSVTLLTLGVLSYQATAQNSQGTYLHNTTKLAWEFRGKSVMKVVDADTPSGKEKRRHRRDVLLGAHGQGSKK